jgi:hypothetical protein
MLASTSDYYHFDVHYRPGSYWTLEDKARVRDELKTVTELCVRENTRLQVRGSASSEGAD